MDRCLVLRSAAAMALLLGTSSAFAIDKIYDPYVDQGEIEVEYSGFRTQDNDASKNNIQGHQLAVGYGITGHWQVEVTAGMAHDAGGPTVVDEVELENKFQFFEPGEMWIDTGLLVSYAHALHDGDADALEVKLLAQKDFGRISSLANIGFEQGLGGNQGGTDVTVNWNNRYRINKYFQPGIEIQSDFGQTNTHENFNQQQHFIGPAAFGKLFSGTEYGEVKYEAAYLFGVTSASPQSAGRLLLEYERVF